MHNLKLVRAVPVVAVMISLALTGCVSTTTSVTGVPTGSNLYTAKSPPKGAEAGIPLADPISKHTVQEIAHAMSVPARHDPFRLTATEVRFDRQQRTERLLTEAGGYVNLFTPTQDIDFAPRPLQSRPLWRLSGVVVSENGIVALLDMGGGRSMVIRPGTLIDEGGFVVESLNQDRAVLRRLDQSLEPHRVTIELSGPLSGPTQTGPAGVGGPGNNGGTPAPPQGGSTGAPD